MAPSERDLLAQSATSELLRQRERLSLRWSAGMQLGIVIASSLIIPFAGVAVEKIALGLMLLLFGSTLYWVFRRLGHEQADLVLLGWVVAATAASVLIALPVLWHLVYTTDAEPLMHLRGHNYTAVCSLLMVLSAVTQRPKFPALVTAIAVIAHVVIAALALTDWRLQTFRGGLGAAIGLGSGGTDVLVITPLLLAMAGTVLTLGAKAARRTTLEAVALEQAEREVREQQLQAVLEARMAALGDLVAGVQHEVNNPLGAMRSASDTGTRAVEQLRTALASGDESKLERALSVLQRTLDLSTQAGNRMAEVMSTIKGFVQLDAAELQRTKLATLVHNSLSVEKSRLRNDTRLQLELDEQLEIKCDPRRLGQALATVIRNAAEAFEQPGELRIRVKSQAAQALVEVADQGRGMDKQQIARLFELEFGASTRVHARFGLPLVRSIVHRHGGEIEVESELGRGTTVTFRLPLS